MQVSGLNRILALSLLLLFPAASFASDNAMLFPQGKVNVNGTALASSSALFTGDNVTTGSDSGVVLTERGATVQLAANSKLSFAPDVLELPDGGATVSTTSAVRAHTMNLTVEPTSAALTRYILVHRGNQVGVAALAGQVRLNDGRQQMVLDSGKAVMFDVPPATDDKDKDNKNTQPASNTGMNMSNKKAVMIGTVVALLGAGLAYGLVEALSPGQASPVCPKGQTISNGVCH